MSKPVISTEAHPNDCGCCEGLGDATPLEIFNRPGLKAVSYRVGTHARFKRTMLARLSSSKVPALRGLNTREDDDFTVALLDAWAVVADVLTFYQERIANESYLRTATERMSLLELARLIGYELRPGVAAGTYLAFTLDELPAMAVPAIPDVAMLFMQSSAEQSPDLPRRTLIQPGLKVQSVPGPGEKPQIFETVEHIDARIEWNAIKPRLTRPYPSASGINSIFIEGLTTVFKPGDRVLAVLSANPADRTVHRIKSIENNPRTNRTRIRFEAGAELASGVPSEPPPGNPTELPAAPTSLSDSFVRGTILSRSWRQDDLLAFAAGQNWSLEELATSINKQLAPGSQQQPLEVFALRVRASLFGHNAPQYTSLPAGLREGEWVAKQKKVGATSKEVLEFVAPSYLSNWEERTLKDENDEEKTANRIYLDNTYPAIVKGNWLVLEGIAAPTSNPLTSAFVVQDYAELSRSKFTVSAKVSFVTLNSNLSFDSFTLRGTSVFAQSEKLGITELPIEEPVGGSRITLDRAYLGISSGQRIVITGERADIEGVVASEVREVGDVTLEGGYTKLSLKESLDHQYLRDTVTINANVARATHGETRQEILGSGDTRIAFQRFKLRQPPLTHVSAPTASGAQSTLEVRVNDVLWREVSSFYGRGRDERIYITRTDDEGNTTVQFGDGLTGARLPTGQDNVSATYRRGIGVGGLVKARQLSLLMQRPHGVKEVSNPLAADGADDPEPREQARRNAPLTVLTLERIVSLRDYEDFARSFSGIAKSLATWTWNGQRRGVFLTVAGPNGALVKEGSALFDNLLNAMRKAGDQSTPLTVKSYVPAFFKLAATLKIKTDYQPELVLKSVRETLLSRFSFEARSFGQPVMLSEVIALVQNVAGVVAVNITSLAHSGTIPAATPPTYLAGAMPQEGGDSAVMQGAALLMLDPTALVDVGVSNL
jgi:predicted phage baseplate assembly protein